MISLVSRVKKSFSYEIEGCYRIFKGTLPPGISFTDGRLSGRFTTSGVYRFSMKEKSKCGCSVKTFIITVRKARKRISCIPEPCTPGCLAQPQSSSGSYVASIPLPRYLLTTTSLFTGNVICNLESSQFSISGPSIIILGSPIPTFSYNCETNTTTLKISQLLQFSPPTAPPTQNITVNITQQGDCPALSINIVAVKI